MTPEAIAKWVAMTITSEHPELDSRDVNARTTAFLVEALGFVLLNSTLPGPARDKAIEIVCEGIRGMAK